MPLCWLGFGENLRFEMLVDFETKTTGAVEAVNRVETLCNLPWALGGSADFFSCSV